MEARVQALEEALKVANEARQALEADKASAVPAVSVKLPPFWPDQTALWFVQAKAEFLIANITVDRTKFAHIVQVLDSRTAAQAMDIINNPPAAAF